MVVRSLKVRQGPAGRVKNGFPHVPFFHGTAIKLEGLKNGSVWKFQVTVTLKGADSFCIVSGEEKREKPENFDARDAKAQSFIV